MCKTAVLMVLLFSFCGSARAADAWPQFRGPDGQGHAPAADLPLQWSDTRNVTWKVATPGGWSSPVYAGGRLYLTAAVPVGGRDNFALSAICLDAADGSKLWATEVFSQAGGTAPGIHNKNSHASPTPVLDGDRLFVHFGHQGAACLGLDGKVIWRRTISYAPVHGNGGSPAVVGDKLIFSCDGASDPFVIALHKANGETAWQTPRSAGARKKFSFSTPLAIDVDGRTQVVLPGSDAVCAYDPATGRELWRAAYDGYSVIPRPVFGHGLLFVSSGFDRPTLYAIRADGRGDVTRSHVAWSMSRGAPHTPSPLLVGDELYVLSDRGILTCADAKTGQVHWQEQVRGAYSASPLYVAAAPGSGGETGRIYCQSETGETTVVAADKAGLRVLGESKLPEKTLASFAVGGDALFIRTEGHLYRVEKTR
jgi:outer membrane protein assembly factor BamB